MKLFKTIYTFGVLAIPSALSAASPSQSLQVHVPFSFVMAGQEFNPGNYRVQQNDNGIVFVQGNGKAAMALSTPGSFGKPGAPSSLQFTSDQEREYLTGIHVEGEPSRAIPARLEASRKLTFTSTR